MRATQRMLHTRIAASTERGSLGLNGNAKWKISALRLFVAVLIPLDVPLYGRRQHRLDCYNQRPARPVDTHEHIEEAHCLCCRNIKEGEAIWRNSTTLFVGIGPESRRPVPITINAASKEEGEDACHTYTEQRHPRDSGR